MGDQHNTDDWAAQAMALLRKDGLSPTPDNFAVYYAYCSGANPNLKISMDMLLDQNGKLTQSQCTELFLAHISLDAESRVLKKTVSSIEEEIQNMVRVLSQSATNTEAYNQTLNTFSGALQSSPSLENITAAVNRVMNETRVMAEQNQRLHVQLSQSTQQISEMRYNLNEVHKASLTDPLTEIGNRKFFSNEMERVRQEADETGAPLSILMIDIDHFKQFNDVHGHLVGDEVLRLVARTLVENLKGRDIIARYGGEEFVILLPQTAVQDAERVANQLRSTLATKQIRRRRTNETLGTVTISLGGAQYIPGEDPEALIARADEALYEAKQTGRNKVVVRK